VDTCDGILFMLSTSLTQDVYRRHWRPQASDRELLRVARTISIAAGALGVVLSIYLATVIGALRVFYSVLGVSLFVPVIGGLVSRRASSIEALASIAAGIATLAVVGLAPLPYPWLDPTLSGLVASTVAFVLVLAVRRSAPHAPHIVRT
jgi:SSS family solute:Na+ symporter